MSSAPYMQFYVGDYIKKTLHLSTEENGAYLLLLFAMWQGDGSLPNDATKLARIARVSPKRWAKVWPEIVGFFTVDGDVIYQDRLTKELQKVLSISQERKTAGRLGGKAKALKDNVVRLAIANDLPWHSQISEPEPEYSEAKASAPMDFAKEVWSQGVQFLKANGKSDGTARAIIGKWRKDHPDEAILNAFMACSKAGAVEPVAWITGRLGKKKPDHLTAEALTAMMNEALQERRR